MHNHLTDRGDPSSTSLTVSWSAFHGANEADELREPTISALLPVHHEKSGTLSMMNHGIDKAIENTNFLNEGQTPVLCMDQPLLTLCKIIQWNFPEKYGPHKLVLLLGPLHIELAFLRLLGSYTEGCGLTSVIINSGILTAGTAEGTLKHVSFKQNTKICGYLVIFCIIII